MLLGSVRAVDRAGVVSNRSSLCPSTHLSLGLPRGLFPPTFIVVTLFATCVSSLLITWPCHVEYHREKAKVVKWYGHGKRIGEGHVLRRMLDAVPGEGERKPDGN